MLHLAELLSAIALQSNKFLCINFFTPFTLKQIAPKLVTSWRAQLYLYYSS